jgi:hypothetical protein
LARDPAFLFDTPVFKEFGNIFWGDIYNESLVNIKAYDYVGESHVPPRCCLWAGWGGAGVLFRAGFRKPASGVHSSPAEVARHDDLRTAAPPRPPPGAQP